MRTRKKHIESLEHIAEDVDVAEGNNQRDGGEEKEAGEFRELPLQVGEDPYQQQVSRPGRGGSCCATNREEIVEEAVEVGHGLTSTVVFFIWLSRTNRPSKVILCILDHRVCS